MPRTAIPSSVRSLPAVAALIAVTTLVAGASTGAQAHAASQAAGQVGSTGLTLAIDSMTPQSASTGSIVKVTGTVTNSTGSSLSGLTVQLYSWDAPFTARELMDSWAGDSASSGSASSGSASSGSASTSLTAEGLPVSIAGPVRPGGSVTWHAQFTSTAAAYQQSGVYPVEAQVSTAAGGQASARTLLPYWTGNASKLKIAWDWPLIDQPHRQACKALTDNSLAASLANAGPDGGGRLNTLLRAASSNPAAKLTWLIDPALLTDVQTMTKGYQTGGTPDCVGSQYQPASTAAQQWLTTLRSATTGEPTVMTPYANVDVAALVHSPGLLDDLQSAYALGQQAAGRVLTTSVMNNSMLFPAGGVADQSVLAALAAREQVSSAVLDSGAMPARDPAVPDDAVTSFRTGAGTRMTVLLADDTLTSVLKQASGNLSGPSQFAVEQRFLAETAMIAAEAPNSSRSVVVSPPETWAPSLPVADALLKLSTSTPWLQPATLSSLVTAHDSYRNAARKLPAANKVGSRELSSGYLAGLKQLGSRLDTFGSMLVQQQGDYSTGLVETLAATESSSWRGGGAAKGAALSERYNEYLQHAEGSVTIVGATGTVSKTGEVVQMAGSSGLVPVTVHNQLQQTVKVHVSATVVTVPGAPANRLTVGGQKTVTIRPGQVGLVKLSVHSAPQGSTTIRVQLSSAGGTPLTFADRPLTIDSTRYGQAILILIAAAIGLLLLTSVFRSGRKRAQASRDSGGAHGGGGAGGGAHGGGAHGGGEGDRSEIGTGIGSGSGGGGG